MEDIKMKELVQNISKWRASGPASYWLRVGYIGAELNRVGDHDLTVVGGVLYRRWEGKWRKVEDGKDFWLFTVPGSFAWARDILMKVVPEANDVSDDDVVIEYDAEHGYIKTLKVSVGQRASANFTYEVKRFGSGPAESFAQE